MTLENYNINLALLGWINSQNYSIQDQSMFINPELFTIGDVQGFLGEKNNILYVCFQGTANYSDVKDDLDFKKIDVGSGIKIHEGFYKQYKEVENFLMEKVKAYNQIIFCGFSLGSSIATIAAYFIKQKFFNSKEISCILWASPKVGNKNFVKAFNNSHIAMKHYRYKNDIIPRVPYSILGYRYLLKPTEFGKYKWYEYLYYPIVKLFGNPFDHTPANYMTFKI